MCCIRIQSVALLVFFVSALTSVRSRRYHQIFCNISQPKEDDCLTLFEAFRDGIFCQHDNLFRLDLVFNTPSGISPVLVRAVYNMNLTGIDDCSEDFNQTVVLGWTSQSLYRYFHAAVINQVRLQLPYVSMLILERNRVEEEPFIDDYLWIASGKIKLPEVHLSINVNFSDGLYTLSDCPLEGNITKALGELTHWLKAYAKVAQRDSKQAKEFANPDYKGYTLSQNAVEHYAENLWQTRQGEVGEIVFIYLYALNILITLGWTIYSLSFSTSAYEVYDRIVKESDLNEIQLDVAAHLAFAYLMLLVMSEIIQDTRLPTSFDYFLFMKYCSIILIVVIVVSISIIKWLYSMCCKSDFTSKKYLVVAVLASAISILSLDITPTTILFFVFPTDTFSLLTIHAALFYTEVMVGTLSWLKCQPVKKRCQSCKSCVSSNNKTFQELRDVGGDHPAGNNRKHIFCTIARCCGRMVMYLIVSVLSIVPCVALVYFPAIYFFQFLILRNANSGAFDILIKYIPSIAIGFFGIYIRKALLYKDDKDDKHEKLWLKLGELLTTEEVNKESKKAKHLESLRTAYHIQD